VLIIRKINKIKNRISHFLAIQLIKCKLSMTFKIHMQKAKINIFLTKIYLILNKIINIKTKTKTYTKS